MHYYFEHDPMTCDYLMIFYIFLKTKKRPIKFWKLHKIRFIYETSLSRRFFGFFLYLRPIQLCIHFRNIKIIFKNCIKYDSFSFLCGNKFEWIVKKASFLYEIKRASSGHWKPDGQSDRKMKRDSPSFNQLFQISENVESWGNGNKFKELV